MVKYWAAWGLIAGLAWPALGAARNNPEQSEPSAPAAGGGTGSEACVSPSPKDTEAAKRAFRVGQSAFSDGDYSLRGRALALGLRA